LSRIDLAQPPSGRTLVSRGGIARRVRCRGQLLAVVRRCRWAGLRGVAALFNAQQRYHRRTWVETSPLSVVCVSLCTAICKAIVSRDSLLRQACNQRRHIVAATPDARRVSFSRLTTSPWLAGTNRLPLGDLLTEDLLRPPKGRCSSRRHRIHRSHDRDAGLCCWRNEKENPPSAGGDWVPHGTCESTKSSATSSWSPQG
jgi:hypothetical protein